jgi:hypothetical protein
MRLKFCRLCDSRARCDDHVTYDSFQYCAKEVIPMRAPF